MPQYVTVKRFAAAFFSPALDDTDGAVSWRLIFQVFPRNGSWKFLSFAREERDERRKKEEVDKAIREVGAS